jgi:RimJ/RimL family protein N-acetyltransferase
MLVISTSRLDLVATSTAHLDAELESTDRLARMLDAIVPPGWPPGEYDRPAIEFFRGRLEEDPDAVGWYTWYAVRRRPAGETAVVVGAGGYFGPPGPDGVVEVGYSIVESFRAQGFASELVEGLVARAFATPGVVRVVAVTYPENVGSVRVLERCGFTLDGPGREPNSSMFARTRPAA